MTNQDLEEAANAAVVVVVQPSTENEISSSDADETLLISTSTTNDDSMMKQAEGEQNEEEPCRQTNSNGQEKDQTKNNVVAEDDETNKEEKTQEDEEDDDELNYEITIVSNNKHRRNHSLEDDTMSVISCLTFAEATPNHGHQQECRRTPASLVPIPANHTKKRKPGTIIKKLLHLGDKRPSNDDQNKFQSDDVRDLERGLSKTTVFTSMDDSSSSSDSDTPLPSPLEEEDVVPAYASAEQQQQQQYVSPTTTYSEMKGFMIAISIACVGVLLLGLACLLWWTSHNNGEQHYQVSSSVTDRQDHFIPGSRFLGEDSHEHARFSLAPEVEVLDYMLKAASQKST